MARRSVWLVTGVVAGAASSLYAERKLRRTLEAAQARLQPDALAVEVGRTARQAASNTGVRLREAVATARVEKRRRETELWTELQDGREDPAAPGDPGPRPDPATTTPDPDDAAEPRAHISLRRLRRVARNYPTHLAN
jgi:hypothetical protein